MATIQEDGYRWHSPMGPRQLVFIALIYHGARPIRSDTSARTIIGSEGARTNPMGGPPRTMVWQPKWSRSKRTENGKSGLTASCHGMVHRRAVNWAEHQHPWSSRLSKILLTLQISPSLRGGSSRWLDKKFEHQERRLTEGVPEGHILYMVRDK